MVRTSQILAIVVFFFRKCSHLKSENICRVDILNIFLWQAYIQMLAYSKCERLRAHMHACIWQVWYKVMFALDNYDIKRSIFLINI